MPDLVVTYFDFELNGYYKNLGSGLFDDLTISGFGPPSFNPSRFRSTSSIPTTAESSTFSSPTATSRIRRCGRASRTRSATSLMWNDGHGRFHEQGCGPAFEEAFVSRGSAVATTTTTAIRHRGLELGRPAPPASQRRHARKLARRLAEGRAFQPRRNRREARRGAPVGKEARSVGRVREQLPLVLRPAGALRLGPRNVGPEADDHVAVGHGPGPGESSGRSDSPSWCSDARRVPERSRLSRAS